MKPLGAFKKIIRKSGGEIDVREDVRPHLLEKLLLIQEQEGYISDENMQLLADELGIHPVEVYSVVTFYAFLSTEKKGKHIIRISNCVPCMMKGSKRLAQAFEEKLGIKCGETTDDGQYTLEETSCIGMCDSAPAIMVDDKLIGSVTPGQIDEILNELK